MRGASLLALVLLLTACGTIAPTIERPALDDAKAERFISAAPTATAPTEDDLHWWRRFDDPALSTWVEAALAGNLDIAVATERIQEAQALLRIAQADRRPSAIGGARATATKRDGAGAGGTTTTNTRSGGSASVELDLSWDADLWGGLRYAEQSAAATVLRSRDLAQAARLTAAGAAARVYTEWREAQAEMQLLQEAAQLRQDTLRIAKIRADVGLAPTFDVLRAQADLSATEAELAQATAEAKSAYLALQVLAGKPPLAAAPSADARRDGIPSLLGAPWVPRPVDLLRLRADVRAAEQAMAASFAEIGVANAALYPQLRLPGQLVLTATGLGSGNVAQVLTASLSALLQAPLFDGGRNAASLDAARARAREAALLYRKTVLEAMRQVEAALIAHDAAQARIASLASASESSAAALRQARTLYTEGLAGFLEVLEAQRTWLDNRRQLMQARAQAARAGVAVFEAIGLIRDPETYPETIATSAK
jgi:multidrug efflux system outer membrane protein